jgi:hypothetical protein
MDLPAVASMVATGVDTNGSADFRFGLDRKSVV